MAMPGQLGSKKTPHQRSTCWPVGGTDVVKVDRQKGKRVLESLHLVRHSAIAHGRRSCCPVDKAVG